MSTNFYLPRACPNPCEHCSVEDLHIGKRSGGWQFHFQAHPGIRSRKDWEARVDEVGTVTDEYGREYTPEQFWAEVDATRKPWGPDGIAPMTHHGMRGKQGIPLNDPANFLDDQGWDFTENEFS